MSRLLLLAFLAALASQATAQPSAQPIDSAYTRKIHEYTTEPFFTSPLVNYLPASSTVPTPQSVLGDIAGSPAKLPYSADVYAYMRKLAAATPRVRVYSIGRTEEGREMIAVAIASDSLMASLDANRARLAQLGDPRVIGMDDKRAAAIVDSTTPIYYITGTIHSSESGAPSALMELAYRLAVDEGPYVKNIRDHLITLITPIVEVDGRDRMVDLSRWHAAHPGETYPSLLYWGHYVAHDNNRDAMALTLKLSQNVLNTYLDWHAQVLHDLHESVPYLYDNTVGDGPYNAWLDPLLTNEWQMIGWNNVQEMTRYGMPGVFAHGDFDTWSPGYLMFMAATHNGISRLYETFGNAMPETEERELEPSETARTWYRQDPPLPRVKWSMRDNNNYEETGLLVSLSYFAKNGHLFLSNFYEKSKRSILKAHTEGPAAYVFPVDDPRPGTQAELLRILQKQRVEITRATSPFTVSLHRTHGDTTRSFPAGSYIVRMDQPYSRIADALLDYQYWSPNDPQKTPYDDTGWTFPELFAVDAVRVTDPSVLNAANQRVTDTVRAPGGVNGSGTTYVINHNGDNALVTLRYKLKTADISIAEDTFRLNGKAFNRGSFVIKSGPGVTDAIKALGLTAYATTSAPSVKTHPARAARIALVHTWLDTQDEGWWRQTLDFAEVPFTYISTQEIAKEPDLSAKYDVILLPPSQTSVSSIIEGLPMWRNPMPWKHTALTPNFGTWAETDDVRPGLGWQGLEHLQSFARHGGVIVTAGAFSDLATEYGLTNGVFVNDAPHGHVVGSVLRTKIVDDASPITYGIRDGLAVYTEEGESFGITNVRGGRRRRFGGDSSRATGRGTADDPDVIQGRPALDTAFEARPVPKTDPWMAAPVGEEQERRPINIIPPDQRPRVALRFADKKSLLVSGLLDGGGDIAEHPMVV
ncbi:MAG TPA: M14 family zinc carboxypeptidase, partial [Gemmatimonadaceae bacterium]|nr:M14 family zinc carboxypeptidase [Gemmatimonadaceae bacterium]